MLTPQDILERLRRAGYRHIALETDAFGRAQFVFVESHRVTLRNWGAFNRKLARVGLRCGEASIGTGGTMHRMDIRELDE